MTTRTELQAALKQHRQELGTEQFNAITESMLNLGLRSSNNALQMALDAIKDCCVSQLIDETDDEELYDPELHLSEADVMDGLDLEPVDSTPHNVMLSDVQPITELWDCEGIDLDMVQQFGIICCDVCHGQKVDLAPSRLRRYEQMYRRVTGLPIGDVCSISSDSVAEWEHGVHIEYANYHNYPYCLYDYTPLTEPVITKGMCPLGLDCPGDGDCQSCWSCKAERTAERYLGLDEGACSGLLAKFRTQQASWQLATSGHYRDY